MIILNTQEDDYKQTLRHSYPAAAGLESRTLFGMLISISMTEYFENYKHMKTLNYKLNLQVQRFRVK